MPRIEDVRAYAKHGLTLVLGGAAAILLISRPLEFPDFGLDPSWKYAAEYAYLNGLTFGRDLSFTAGPLSFVYTQLFHPDTFHWIVISTVHASLVFLAAVWWSPSRSAALACLAVLALVFAPLAPDALFLALCLMIFLMAIGGRTPMLVVAILVIGLAIPSLAKFNVLVLALPLMILADATALARHARCYGLSVIYCLSLLAFYALSGQPIGAFGDFLRGSLDVAVGYGEAGQNFWWSSQQTVIVIASLAILATSWALTRHAPDRMLRAAYLVGSGMYLFLAFKAGNIRAGHQYTTWNALAISTSIFFMAPGLYLPELRRAALIGGSWAIACFLMMQHFVDGRGPIGRAAARARHITEQVTSAIGWLDPKTRFAELQGGRRSAEAELARNAPPNLVGALGSLPWDFSEIIAAGYRFVPQPSLQQYVSYTPRSRARDQRHFAGEPRPDYLLFRLATIDGHYRTIELGPSLPHILAGYDLVDVEGSLVGGSLLLRRREEPRPIELRKLDETSARFGEWVDVPRLKHGGLMLSIHLEERLSGKLMTLLYKQSSLLLELKFANGAAVTSRILRNLVSDGFLVLSPDIDSAGLLLQAERNFDIAGENPLISIRVSPVDLANVAFSPTYVLSTMSVSVIGAPEQPRSARPPSADDAMRRLRTGQIIASSGLRMIDGRLLAHAPSKISARFPGDRELSGEIGFFDGAWKTGKPQPVTFVISALTSMGAKPLLERTLDPLNRTEDRGPQFFSIALPAAFPPGTTVELLFETRPETPWGWTYWSNLQMTPPVEGR